jgi:hypothetical protein
VGRVIVDREIPKAIIRIALLRAWKPMGSFSIHQLGDNMFLFDFEHEWDESRILEIHPWLFYRHLVSLKEFDGYTLLEDKTKTSTSSMCSSRPATKSATGLYFSC